MSGLIVVIGSGELGESMRSTHRRVLEHTGANSIAMLDSPYGFQENADALTKRMVSHFQKAFGVKVDVASLRSPNASDDERKAFIDAIGRAQVVFAGPGSPSFALRVWADLGVRESLKSVVERGGAVVMASAAALTIGAKAIPVYEIYKVGEDLRWLDGIDLLSDFGLNWVVVPHWNNREGGGFHDTSHCFIGARRFHRLVDVLPDSISVVGVDEHTSLIIDPFENSLHVLGKGVAYLNEEVISDGQKLKTPALRPALRQLAEKAPDPKARLDDEIVLIDLLVELRSTARDRNDYAESDRIRKALARLDIEVHDLPDGSTWNRK